MPSSSYLARKQAHAATRRRRSDLRERQGNLYIPASIPIPFLDLHELVWRRYSRFREERGGWATDAMLRGEEPDTRPRLYFVLVKDNGSNDEISERDIICEDLSLATATATMMHSYCRAAGVAPATLYVVCTPDEHHLAEAILTSDEYINSILSPEPPHAQE